MQEASHSTFNALSTASEVIGGISLADKTAVVTGGSAGLGLETARALASAGATVFLGARTANALQSAKQAISESVRGSCEVHPLDLTDPRSIEDFASAFSSLGRPLDILVNNAGIMACPFGETQLGVELQLATNFLGHALLTSLLAPRLSESGAARVISLSSVGHHFSPVVLSDPNFRKRRYDKWAAYGQSKTACSLLAVKVEAELSPKGVAAFAVHPGMIPTDLARFLTPEDYEESRAKLAPYMANMRPYKTLETGAATSVWAATSQDLRGHGMAYLEDCQVAPVLDEPNFGFGVMRYALDRNVADGLWAFAETSLGRKLSL